MLTLERSTAGWERELLVCLAGAAAVEESERQAEAARCRKRRRGRRARQGPDLAAPNRSLATGLRALSRRQTREPWL